MLNEKKKKIPESNTNLVKKQKPNFEKLIPK